MKIKIEHNFLKFKNNIKSQNGEDGIIEAIFSIIGTKKGVCCEFGAWDGIHLSNCRQLILDGWRAVMIEGDTERFKDLVANYKQNSSVICTNRFVDTDKNSLDSILAEKGINNLDFLSIDIDGLDYEILETLKIHPKVICIETNAGFSPQTTTRLPREIAKNNVGQPLYVMMEIARTKGYSLLCFSGNAFFVQTEIARTHSLPELSAEEAYSYFIEALPVEGREWLFLANKKLVSPFYRYANPYLSRKNLKLSLARAFLIWLKAKIKKI